MSEGHIRRTNSKSFAVVLDLGKQRARRCLACNARLWRDSKRNMPTRCPKCRGELRDTLERRQKYIGGFATRAEAEAALEEATGVRKTERPLSIAKEVLEHFELLIVGEGTAIHLSERANTPLCRIAEVRGTDPNKIRNMSKDLAAEVLMNPWVRGDESLPGSMFVCRLCLQVVRQSLPALYRHWVDAEPWREDHRLMRHSNFEEDQS